MGNYRQGERAAGQGRHSETGTAPSRAIAPRTSPGRDGLGRALDDTPRVQSLLELRSSLDARARLAGEARPVPTGADDTRAASRADLQGRIKPLLHAKTGAVEQMGRWPASASTQRVVLRQSAPAAAHSAGPVLQRAIILEKKFKANAELMKAYRRIEYVLAQDHVLGELYRHAKADKSNLVFKVGDLTSEAAVGLTELFHGDTKITAQNAAQVLGGDTKDRSFETHITIDDGQIAKLLEERARGDHKHSQPTDMLQILAHEYGVHATKNLAFLKQLGTRGDAKARSAHVAEAFAPSGSMSGGTHHAEHLHGEASSYNALSAALQIKLPKDMKLSLDEQRSFLESEGDDRAMINAVLAELKPAMDKANAMVGQAADVKHAMERPLKFVKKPAGSSAPVESTCFITTACTRAHGLPDDCEELTVLRAFRDGVLCRFIEGRELCAQYYRVSPQIVQAIGRSGREEELYVRLYATIRSCVDAIQRGDERWAFQTYSGMVLLLMQLFPATVSW
ncbi:hypothetical protein JQ557_11120 [Bradyrhizobium sp. U87765 SZCCT0131]|uniref:CFI-box-CTERM domain-containing protein n=1 Tax=unclassified Bradyrhizobium TaxID=2631580 RepID=UPI001BA844A2|nr:MULTISPECIES: CFI-box-CTERM domain-containing protein [unclassified Bradyrhizobium]MBR1218543.1 hypothetical protein [Bradyrhizobium sp. U87765 SZCCT0131]MBR1260511.1 hypothetical protein [Bradyrhizobium sp. U87765 SZCCT0134]MBR1304041.1 hypothetical protein [Bradyrhizobium sp. U87765 SZCCT0110]MBR1319647.1 hypothetical protein [Bradyrhizobium sp. U87765 SZCCT0109]MBR1347972.1 hypothetical protein [Bradyrhizobium sp. U87765 SZCCT0048]